VILSFTSVLLPQVQDKVDIFSQPARAHPSFALFASRMALRDEAVGLRREKSLFLFRQHPSFGEVALTLWLVSKGATPPALHATASSSAAGYRVLVALAELDSGFANSEVLVADTVDGAPIDARRGPFRLVAPHDKRPVRWVRMLKSITVSSPKELN
jgi:hypothetical protein